MILLVSMLAMPFTTFLVKADDDLQGPWVWDRSITNNELDVPVNTSNFTFNIWDNTDFYYWVNLSDSPSHYWTYSTYSGVIPYESGLGGAYKFDGNISLQTIPYNLTYNANYDITIDAYDSDNGSGPYHTFETINFWTEGPPAGAEVTFAVSPPTKTVEVGETFTVNITVDPTVLIDTVATDEITFTSGKLGCTKVEQGDLFNESTFWIGGHIHNASGNITDVVWGSHTPASSPGTFVILTFKALEAGTAYINITFGDAGAAYNMTARTIDITSNGTITIQFYIPEAPSGFDATAHNRTRMDLSWTNGNRSDSTYIVAKKGSYPTDRTDGTNIYNGTGASAEHNGLLPGEHWYYRAWSWNDTGKKFSTTYDQANAFTTSNEVPTFSSESPTNESIGVDVTVGSVSVYVGDPEGDELDIVVTFPGYGSDEYYGVSANDTYSTETGALSLDTTYYWSVSAFDGYAWSNATYQFTTRSAYVPAIPSDFNTIAYNRTRIDITWTKGADADATYIEWNTSASWTRGEGNFLFSGSAESTEHTGLYPGTHYFYQAWSYNATDGVYSSGYASDDETTMENSPPVLSNENPSNNSIDVPLRDVLWNVTIEDPEGDYFDWTIECSGWNVSNDNYDSALAETNGSKEVHLGYQPDYPLDYATIYTIWVNVTDGMGWTNATYQFTTRSTYVPLEPADFNALKFNRSQINITWTNGVGADATYIEWNTSATWTRGEGNFLYNGTDESKEHNGLSPGIRYYYQAWSYNATDGVYSSGYASDDEKTGENNAPELANEVPLNESIDIDINLAEVTIDIGDKDNEPMDYTIHGTYINTASGNIPVNGTLNATIITPLPYNTVIYWYVEVTDGFNWTNATYHFTTRDRYYPGIPSGLSATATNRFEIGLSWSKGTNADYTYVEKKQGSYPTSRTDGTNIYNGTGSTKQDTGLSPGAHWYYSVWSYNKTDNTYSVSYAQANTSTIGNNAPTYGTPNPTNGSTNNVLALSWSIPINDPEGDTFTWSIDCSNGQHSGTSGATNGTKSLSLSSLTYDHTYTVWVNTTDLYSGTTHAWYQFTTRGKYYPNVPTSFTATTYNRTRIDLSWSKGSKSDSTYIRAKLGSAPSNRADGNFLYNGSGTGYQDTGLSPSQHWYFAAWSFNNTDGVWSNNSAGANATTIANQIPTYGTPSPTNGSTSQPLSLTWSIEINDPEGDSFGWEIECSNGQRSSGGGYNGTKSLPISGLAYSTTYTVWVNSTDYYGGIKRVWYHFGTRDQYIPSVPSGFTATGYSTSQINMTWSKGSMADKTYIERNSYQTWTRGTGTPIYNNTGSLFADTGRSAHTKYFYQVWSWNYTDGVFSISYEEANGTTLNNLPNQITNERPVNNTPYTTVYRKYLNVTVSDPDGDSLTVYFKWQNGTTIAFATVASGAVASIYLPNYINPDWLTHSTDIRWYVVVNDSVDQIQSPVFKFTTCHQADVDEDRDVDITDVSIEVAHYGEDLIAGSQPWDIVENGKVDVTDISRLVMFYGETF